MLSGQKVLITGASSGIGKACCQVFTREGAQVIATGRKDAPLKEVKANGNAVEYVLGDLTVTGECKRIVTEAANHLGGLTALVNCAGVLQGGAIGSVSLDNYMFNFKNNVQTVFEMMEHSIPFLQEAAAASHHPSIVNISSVNGKQAFAGCATYCASKAAVDQLTRCASVDLAPKGIRVNAVNPGVVITDLQKRGGMSDEAYEKFIDRSIKVTHPLAASLGRCCTPEEVGELCCFLVSAKASFITGECIAIDGSRQNLGAR
mmetsp:Transcript_29516/g.36461  ORF Transcript_29516/g.36461 Transcript_29516/m.36461 type:complete len:261 (-) Transcript_29516:1387-2169(-)|eukprot:CAMPEP_0204836886 /NCGR_PEP_ID=MMETSP1346-20131115/26494_1 /ASSEMBLY_ACC=CAM_ASM_000771 /TAXON_ID=215587 /ORGANISM="Aplanochytrium stocchinoi, Strain GSBS06" /LENGTH=260 /DNA_ID=CAMNT_0051971981 /DNA_START=48 /DNA_END=830 /DNA_ORIENTATION=-